MWKDLAVITLISAGMLSAAGCRSHDYMKDDQAVAAQETQPQANVPADQIPSDVIKAVHQHVLEPSIIHASTIIWKGRLAYKVYVKSGNTVYIVKIRPDGYYLGQSVYND